MSNNYDKVVVKCPKCSHDVEFSSGADKCEQLRYSRIKVPIRIALGLNGQSKFCSNCHSEVEIRTVADVRYTPMYVSIVEA